MRYTPAEREDLAHRREQWLLRTEQGEDPVLVRSELKLTQSVRALKSLRVRYEAGTGKCYWNVGMAKPPRGLRR